LYGGLSSSRTARSERVEAVDFAAFVQLVREAYAHLPDRAYLQDHPLTLMLYGRSPLASEQLHRTLLNAIDWLRPLGPVAQYSLEWRRFRHMQLRYLEGAGTEQIAHELRVSARQARRDHADAQEEIARLLWRRYLRPEQTSRSPAAEPSKSQRVEPAPAVEASSADLNAELLKLSAEAPPAPTRLDDLIQGAIDTVSRLAESRGVKVSADISPNLPPVSASRTVLRQLVLGLLADLVSHGGASSIGLKGESENGSVVIRLIVEASKDRGGGRGRAESGREAASVLLGDEAKEIADRLASSLSAELSVKSTADGAAIDIRLPASRLDTLLVVDDNPDVGLLFRRFLADTGYQAVQARSAERALRLAKELQPLAIFLDVLMPSSDGWEILAALRNHPATSHLPVVICSVLPDRDLGLSLGVADFLHKPITREGLLQALARIRASVRDRGSQCLP